MEGTRKALQFLHIWLRLTQESSVCHRDTNSKEQKCLLTGATWEREMVKLEEFLNKKTKKKTKNRCERWTDIHTRKREAPHTRLELTSLLQMRLSWSQTCRHSISIHILPIRWTFKYSITSWPFTPESVELTVVYRKLYTLLYYKLYSVKVNMNSMLVSDFTHTLCQCGGCGVPLLVPDCCSADSPIPNHSPAIDQSAEEITLFLQPLVAKSFSLCRLNV